MKPQFTINGMEAMISRRTPRMQCSAEFARLQHHDLVRETNEWMAGFFGYNELLPDGKVMHLVEQNVLMMNEKTWAQARAIFYAEA